MSSRAKAAVVVALVVVAAACSGRSGHHAAPSSTSTTTARPVVVSHPSALGFLSTPYVTATSGGATHVATVWNWNGRPQAVVHTDPVVDCCTTVSLSPNGTRLQILDGNGVEIVDLHGRVLSKCPDRVGSWAEDSLHQCMLQPHPSNGSGPNGPTDLIVIDPNGRRRVVGAVGYASGLLRCSMSANQAITYQSLGAGIVGPVSQVQLSTGRVSTPAWLPTTQGLSGLKVSGNGDFAAVSQFGNQPTQTEIINTTNGHVLGQVTGSPLAISWDGHVVVEQRDQDIAVIEWRSGTVTWHTQPGGDANPNVFVAEREHSDDLALAAMSQPDQAPDQAALWLIPSNAPARLLDANVLAGII